MQILKPQDLMTTDVKTVSKAHTVQELKRCLREWEISGVPVTSSDGRPVGVVSLTDIARSTCITREVPRGPDIMRCLAEDLLQPRLSTRRCQ